MRLWSVVKARMSADLQLDLRGPVPFPAESAKARRVGSLSCTGESWRVACTEPAELGRVMTVRELVFRDKQTVISMAIAEKL